MKRWPIQIEFLAQAVDAFRAGHRVVCVTAPTGCGKSVAIADTIEHYAKSGFGAVVYTNRRILIDQIARTLDAAKIEYGVRAAGHEDKRERPVQISSLPTEAKRTLPGAHYGGWSIHYLGRQCLAVVDEIHANNNPTTQEIVRRHRAAGHLVLCVTATPIDIGNVCDHLAVAGNLSDGRRCGALVLARHYGCGEPDMRRFKSAERAEDFSEGEQRKAFPMNAALFGRVLGEYRRLNPDESPSIGFAYGVPESLWLAQEFDKAGVPAAHIDGDNVWWDGLFHKSDPDMRRQLFDLHREGKCKVIWNRYVLREGVDLPWTQHVVLACVVGSLQSMIQMVGRGLRACPDSGKGHLVIQDHGGNWWRHGSMNADREWRLDDTAGTVSGGRRERIRWGICPGCGRKNDRSRAACEDCDTPLEREPHQCPACGKIIGGRTCECGWAMPERYVKARPVVQADGTLVQMRGDVFRVQRADHRPGAFDRWKAWYYKAMRGKGGISFAQARFLYAQENDYLWPDPTWHYMPKDPRDLYRRVRDVPPEELIGYEPKDQPAEAQT